MFCHLGLFCMVAMPTEVTRGLVVAAISISLPIPHHLKMLLISEHALVYIT